MSILKTASNKGFTLLEVMISISIIALIFVSLFRMQTGSVALATAHKFNQLAPALANQLIVKISADPDGFSKDQGDFGDSFPGITWTCEVSDGDFDSLDYFSSENSERLKKINLEITNQADNRSFGLTCWRLILETD